MVVLHGEQCLFIQQYNGMTLNMETSIRGFPKASARIVASVLESNWNHVHRSLVVNCCRIIYVVACVFSCSFYCMFASANP
jgi:hypothetical protein